MGPENSGFPRRPDRVEGVVDRGRPVGLPDERPVGRDPLGVGVSLDGTLGGECRIVRFDGAIYRQGTRFPRESAESFPRPGQAQVSPPLTKGRHESAGTHDPCKPKGTRAGR